MYTHTHTQNDLNCTFLTKLHSVPNIWNDIPCLRNKVWHMATYIENEANIQIKPHAQIWPYHICLYIHKMGIIGHLLTTSMLTAIISIPKLDHSPLTRRRRSNFLPLGPTPSLQALQKERTLLLDFFLWQIKFL